jgi:hypothetical protein
MILNRDDVDSWWGRRAVDGRAAVSGEQAAADQVDMHSALSGLAGIVTGAEPLGGVLQQVAGSRR